MKKTLSVLLIVAIVLSMVGCGTEQTVPVEKDLREYNIYLDVASERNMFLATYDIEVFFDNTRVGLLSNGAHCTSLMEGVQEGTHNLFFYKNNDHSIQVSQEYTVDGDATIYVTVHSNSTDIEIKGGNVSSGIIGHELAVPSLTGMVLDDAIDLLKQIGFVNVKYSSDVWLPDNWMVIGQSVDADSIIDKNDKIELSVQKIDKTANTESSQGIQDDDNKQDVNSDNPGLVITSEPAIISEPAISSPSSIVTEPAVQKEQEVTVTAISLPSSILETKYKFSLASVPAYTDQAYVSLNNGVPVFKTSDVSDKSYETYGELDSLGRCTSCIANVGKDIMPSSGRGNISSINPTGWEQNKYDGIDLYERCHLIAYQLTAENANARNLITGTHYMNTVGMMPFENQVAEYIKSTNNHVLYRSTPIFEGDNLLASGVHLEAVSVEDGGKGVMFNIYCYNVQPSVDITYSTGENHKSQTGGTTTKSDNQGKTLNVVEIPTSEHPESSIMPYKLYDVPFSDGSHVQASFVISSREINPSNVFHKPDCKSVKAMSEHNRACQTGTFEEMIQHRWVPCQNCMGELYNRYKNGEFDYILGK